MTPPDDDLDHIMRVMDAAFAPEFGEAWTRRQVSDALAFSQTRYGLIDSGGTMVGHGHDGDGVVQPDRTIAGFYLLRRVLDEAELLLFAIHPDWRRQGLGARLLRAAIESARNSGVRLLFLEMRDGNPAGLLYRQHGFVVTGVRPGYYRSRDGHRHDAISQQLELASPIALGDTP